jgi:hypothetical protein
MKLKCKFGVPDHGWLQLNLSVDGFDLDIEISDVPLNSIDALVSALDCTFDGLEAEVWLHLEPASYYLCFVPLAADKLRLSIEFSERETQARVRRNTLFERVGTTREIILPLWRAIKEFESHSYNEPAWPECNAVKLAQLEKRIKHK